MCSLLRMRVVRPDIPNDVVIWDNVTFHHSLLVSERFSARHEC